MDFNRALDEIEGVSTGPEIGGAPPAYPDFPTEEYRIRFARLTRLMELDDIDALVLTQEESIRYVSGYNSMIWIAAATWLPGALVVTRDPAQAALVVSAFDAGAARGTSWVPEVDGYHDPLELPDLIAAHVQRRVGGGARVLLETGLGSSMRMPFQLAERLVSALNPPADASLLLSAVRMIKSPAEIERLRVAAQAAVRGYAEGIAGARGGMTEEELLTAIGRSMIEHGTTSSSKGLFLNAVCGADRYTLADAPGSDRVLADGDLVFIDGGGPARGYMSDIIRIAAVGEVDEQKERWMEAAVAAAGAIRDAARAGITSSELYEAGLQAYRESGLAGSAGSLFGHGIGLEIWERPFIRRHDTPEEDIRLRSGMTICLEPVLAPVEGGELQGLFVVEDMVAVTEREPDVLSEGLDRSLWRIPA